MFAIIEFQNGATEYYGPAGVREIEDWQNKRLAYWSHYLRPVRAAYTATNKQAHALRNPAGARIITGAAYPLTPIRVGHINPYE